MAPNRAIRRGAWGRALSTVRRRITGEERSRERAFNRIYTRQEWEDPESVSGGGSNLRQTEAIRTALPGLLRELGATSLLDAPCGDFYWMHTLDLTGIHYTGCDIVADLIERNRQLYEHESCRFIRADLVVDPLPAADVVLCRDCLVHLRLPDAVRAVENLIASGSTYLLTTTFPSTEDNAPTEVSGDWRPLNFERAPFGFPPPLRLISEDCPQPGYEDKSLGLWRIADLPSGRS